MSPLPQQRAKFLKQAILNILALVVLSIGLFLPSNLDAKNMYLPQQALLDEVRVNKQILNENPTSANALFELAMSYAYTGQIKKGWDTIKQIPEYDPDFAPKVITKYEALETQDPNNWKYPFKLAFGYYFVKNHEGAKLAFDRVLELDPKQIWALGFKALILGEQSRTQEAIALCNQALSIEPNATAIHFLLAEAWRREGKFFKAARHTIKMGQLMMIDQNSGLYND